MIPVCTPVIGAEEERLVLQCLREGWVSSEGPYVPEFEQKFAAFIGVDHGVAVCNGTAAVEVALYAAGVKEGDEVILPTFTIISCVIAVLRLGAKPVLVDIDPATWCMDVDQAISKITSRTKAIMAVHIYGHPVDMDPLIEEGRRRGIAIVEDAAEAHGAEYKGVRCGAMGDVAAFSFYANKLVTTGEGGMVVCRDPEAARRARSYRNLCFDRDKRFLHEDIGYNFRMTSLQAAVGIGQLTRIDEIIARKREMGALYVRTLSDIPGVRLQVERQWARSVYWMYGLQLSKTAGVTAVEAMRALGEKRIGTRPFFLGLHAQPALCDRGLIPSGERFPVSDDAHTYGFYLPSGLALTDEQILQVCDEVKRAVAR